MSETYRMRFVPTPPAPMPRPAYVIVHNGPLEVGSKVRVIKLGEPEVDGTVERITFMPDAGPAGHHAE
jgi:hypothetical protein